MLEFVLVCQKARLAGGDGDSHPVPVSGHDGRWDTLEHFGTTTNFAARWAVIATD